MDPSSQGEETERRPTPGALGATAESLVALEPQVDVGSAATTQLSLDATAVAPKIKTRKPSAETTFRVLVGEQMDLTALADSKANMMIHINGLIISIMLASSGFILAAQPWLRLPCAALATTSVVSIVFAVLAARPTIHNASPLTADDIRAGRVNMLFFGDFALVFRTLSRHLHGLGHVLLRKFKLLRVSYTAFLFGLFISGALFVFGLLGQQGAL